MWYSRKKAQGEWQSTVDTNVIVKIDKENVEFNYKDESIEGKVKEYNDKYAILDLEGVEGDGIASFKNGNMYIDKEAYKKID